MGIVGGMRMKPWSPKKLRELIIIELYSIYHRNYFYYMDRIKVIRKCTWHATNKELTHDLSTWVVISHKMVCLFSQFLLGGDLTSKEKEYVLIKYISSPYINIWLLWMMKPPQLLLLVNKWMVARFLSK